MNLRLKRRRFGQLALVSAATTALSSFAKKSFAQTSTLIYGVTPDSRGNGLLLQTLNLVTGQIQQRNLGRSLEAGERLSSLTTQLDGTFIVATGPRTKRMSRGRGRRSRLVSSGAQTPTPPQGINRDGAFESLLTTNDGRLLSIVSLNQGTPPFRLADVNRATGQISIRVEVDLPDNRRFSNLCQDTQGAIYATSLGSEGVTKLVQIDTVNRSIITGKAKIITLAELSFNGEPLENDVADLAWSPSNQLFALADPSFEATNSLFIVDVKTGVMQFIRKFAVQKITFSRR